MIFNFVESSFIRFYGLVRKMSSYLYQLFALVFELGESSVSFSLILVFYGKMCMMWPFDFYTLLYSIWSIVLLKKLIFLLLHTVTFHTALTPLWSLEYVTTFSTYNHISVIFWQSIIHHFNFYSFKIHGRMDGDLSIFPLTTCTWGLLSIFSRGPSG